MDRVYEDDRTQTLAVQQGVIPFVTPKKNHGNMTRKSTNVVMKSKDIFCESNDSEKFFPVMINLMLFIHLLFLLI